MCLSPHLWHNRAQDLGLDARYEFLSQTLTRKYPCTYTGSHSNSFPPSVILEKMNSPVALPFSPQGFIIHSACRGLLPACYAGFSLSHTLPRAFCDHLKESRFLFSSTRHTSNPQTTRNYPNHCHQTLSPLSLWLPSTVRPRYYTMVSGTHVLTHYIFQQINCS